MAEPASARGGRWPSSAARCSSSASSREMARMLGPTAGLRCLDLGSDNGVVSLLLRERGGDWASADLTEEAVASIRALVGEDVHLVPRRPAAVRRRELRPRGGRRHARARARRGRLRERAARASRGRAVCWSSTRRISSARCCDDCGTPLGQTDEKHGHLRPGYTPQRLAGAALPALRAREPPHLLALLLGAGRHRLNWGVERLGKKSARPRAWSSPADDLAQNRKPFRAYSAVYPFVWAADPPRRARPRVGLHADRDPEAAARPRLGRRTSWGRWSRDRRRRDPDGRYQDGPGGVPPGPPQRDCRRSAPRASSRASHPFSRSSGPSEPSKNAPCSVKVRRVPSPSATISTVASDAEMRRPPTAIV